MRASRKALVASALAVVLAVSGIAVYSRVHGAAPVAVGEVATTVADLRTLHAAVNVRGKEVRGSARLLAGDLVTTGPSGRARIRMDDSTLLVLDGDTELLFDGAKLKLQKGRIFVQAGREARTEVAFGDAKTTVVSSAAAFEAPSGGSNGASGAGTGKVYCARGELVLEEGKTTAHVASGETAVLAAGGAKVAPEAAFDDWTGGLATPWTGESGPVSAIPELWAGPGGVDPGAPLVVRAETVGIEIEGELAVTRTKTTYFNGSDQSARADVRMALPIGAIVSRVARQNEGAPSPTDAALTAGKREQNASDVGRLEWAGGGFLRGTLVDIPAGKSVDLDVDYVEWLNELDGHATYRFPMASDIEAPLVSGLSLSLTSKGPARFLSTSLGTVVRDGVYELRRADVRPTGDFVVELTPDVVKHGAARAYVAPGEDGEDPYVLVRTEVPEVAEPGVTLAVVVDTSMSVGPSLLETERAVVDSLLEALGPKDSIVVLGIDQSARIIGSETPVAVTPDARTQIRKAMADMRAGGASNLGIGLERAADILDTAEKEHATEKDHAGSGMVVYVGDGRPTVGETSARDLRTRLARRAGGVPRLSAIAVGEGADRWLLAELAQGSGPVYNVVDRSEAARAGGALVADALAPTVRGVSIDLGAAVDRIYPRDARTVRSASTVAVTGRLRGPLPSSITLRYRRGTELVEEARPLVKVEAPAGADIAKRWAEERVEEISMRGEGMEGAVALAAKAGLLTPWTSFFWNGGSASMPWDTRLLGLRPETDTAFAARIAPAPPQPSLLLEPPRVFDGEDTLEDAVEAAARHSLLDSLPALTACRDSRVAVRPDIASSLSVTLTVDVDGHATKVAVATSSPNGGDPVLERCTRAVISAVQFGGSGVSVTFTETIALPPVQTARRTQCSATSTVPIAVKRGIWRARKTRGELDYNVAYHQCELPTWNDRRALLSILVSDLAISQAIAVAASISAAGDSDAAAFVRQELLRRPNISSLAYDDLRKLFVGTEPKIDVALDRAYRLEKNDADRMAVLRKYLRLAPHSPLGRRLRLSLLESSGQKDALRDEIFHIRTDPFSDAGLLAAGASALRRLGEDQEGRRAFGELVERAPRDPWTLAFVGDHLRAEGLYEDALATYQRLDAQMPDDPAVALRLALAQAGAGRLDVAIRLLERSAQTGGRGDDGREGELASIVSASLLAAARSATPAPAADTDALLARRLAETPLPDVASVILVRTPLADDAVEVKYARQDTDKDELPADLDASGMGLSAVRIERGTGTARLHLRRAAALSGARPLHGTVSALVLTSDRSQVKLVTREVDIDEKGVELRWNGESFR